MLPQPQPDGTEASPVADSAVTAPPPADPPAAALVVGPVVVAAPQAPLPGHRAHYDLRHAFMGVAWAKYPMWRSLASLSLLVQWSVLAQGESDTSRSRCQR